jgi:hypothetical protein
MIETIEELKKDRPDLVELFEVMSREELLNQCYLECIDAINMESRVALFMEECTINMSKTNYMLDSLKGMINAKKELDINEFCYYEIVDLPEPSELYVIINDRAKEYLK